MQAVRKFFGCHSRTSTYLINLYTDDHVDFLLVVSLRDEPVDRLQAFYVNLRQVSHHFIVHQATTHIRVHAAFGIHYEVSKKVRFDDSDVQLSIQLDKVWPVESLRTIVPLQILQRIVIGQHFIAVCRVLSRPRFRRIRVALFETERPNLPCLPDLPWYEAMRLDQRLLVSDFSPVLVHRANGCSEEVCVGKEQEQEHDSKVGG